MSSKRQLQENFFGIPFLIGKNHNKQHVETYVETSTEKTKNNPIEGQAMTGNSATNGSISEQKKHLTTYTTHTNHRQKIATQERKEEKEEREK